MAAFTFYLFSKGDPLLFRYTLLASFTPGDKQNIHKTAKWDSSAQRQLRKPTGEPWQMMKLYQAEQAVVTQGLRCGKPGQTLEKELRRNPHFILCPSPILLYLHMPLVPSSSTTTEVVITHQHANRVFPQKRIASSY